MMSYDLIKNYINTVANPSMKLRECVYSESYTLIIGSMEIKGLPYSLFEKAISKKTTPKQKLKECERVISRILKGVEQWQK